ncbi:AAA family ATPase, partial [Adlercreutzia mucosicola]|uniref:AAA family ATPase n=1 Tax=Adlercreutzia mucosicola TaxID=580026 RepID=UPI002B2453AB
MLEEIAGVSRFEALRGRTLSPLVGRREEMDLLLRRWRRARRGEGQVVLISGEAGIGKSRIAEGLSLGLEGEQPTSLRYFCAPHSSSSPLHPIIGHLEVTARFEAGDDADTKLDKLDVLFTPTSKNVRRDAALVAELMGLPQR